MSLTTLTISPKCLDDLRINFREKKFNRDDIITLKTWNSEVERFGHNFIFESHEWRDQPLKGEWKNHRISHLSTSCRVIYQILSKNQVEIAKIELGHAKKCR